MSQPRGEKAKEKESDGKPVAIITLPPRPPSPGTYIPPERRVQREKPPKLSDEARTRMSKNVLIFAAIAIVLTLMSVTPIGGIAATLAPWNASGQGGIVPTATPGPIGNTRPFVSGEHDFVCLILPFARDAQVQMLTGKGALPHPWYVSVMLAQWGVEQGWNMPTYTGYNFGNVSAISGQPSVPGTSQAGSPSRFAYADTVEQGIADYVSFTKISHYTGVAAAFPDGAQAQALALGQSPWDANHYTAIGSPGSSLLNTMKTFNLEQFDNPNTTC